MNRLIPFIVAGAVAAAAGAAAVFFWGQEQRGAGPSAAAPPPEALPTVAPTAGPTGTPSVPAPPAGPPPTFDIVRVSPEGNAVIAGRAAPNAQVTIKDGAAVLGEAVADARGEWVVVPEKKLPAGDRALSVTAAQPGTGAVVKGEAEVVLSIPAREPGAAPSAGGGAPGASGSALAVLVPSRPDAGARALQVPGGEKPSGAAGRALALEVVEYDAAGQVALAGRGEPGAELKLFLDERAVATGKVGADGQWSLHPDDRIAPGRYALRIDELRANGQLAGRISVPFQRAAAPVDGKPGEWLVVQPGHSLWRIARQTYGSGVRYTEVYAANRGQIANPDLIYPGQVFQLPSSN